MGSNPVDTINVDSLKKKLDQWTTYLCYVRTYDRRFFLYYWRHRGCKLYYCASSGINYHCGGVKEPVVLLTLLRN